MSETKNEYLNRLQLELQSLEERLQSLQKSDALPFSFFTESFNRIQNISRLLHELEWLQINEMKQQMEQLVRFLSEVDQRSSTDTKQDTPEKNIQVEEAPQVKTEPIVEPIKETPPVRQNSDGLTLPEYRNPNPSKATPSPEQPPAVPPALERNPKMSGTSVNDMIKQPPTILNLNKYISLNDRFLFQRVLFHNNRDEMNRMMNQLHTFEDFDRAERYLKEVTGWDFDDPVVMDFLDAIKRGFV
jgi:uncharacterized coiled-coil protein SlyX